MSGMGDAIHVGIMNARRYDSKKLAVITGASSGIGFELAKQFALNGFDILIAAEDPGIDEAAVMLRDECDDAVEVIPVRVDLAEEGGVDALYEEIRGVGRPVDAIAINAGIGVSGPFAETDLEDEFRMIALNVNSTVHLAKLVVQDMLDWGGGRILFTASIASVMPAPFMAVYAATKAFIYSFAEGLRDELRDKGVTVTVLMPGPTNTDFFARAGMLDTKAGSEERFENEPEEVAKQGYKALMAGKDHVLAASAKTKLQGAVSKMLPEAIKAKMHRKLTEPRPPRPGAGA